VPLDMLKEIVTRKKKAGKKIIWTNGCFDLLHIGHVLYLEKARALGDMLIVGLNSDASVRAWKTPERPLVNERFRARVLAALSCVDYIVIFEKSSPVDLIAELEPDVFAKGGDYTIESMDQQERRVIDSYGGEFAFIPGVEGMSTTLLLEKIKAGMTQ